MVSDKSVFNLFWQTLHSKDKYKSKTVQKHLVDRQQKFKKVIEGTHLVDRRE